MSRIDMIAANRLYQRINALRRFRDEIKLGQQGFGSDSVRTSIVQSGNRWDVDLDNVGFNDRVIDVTFVPKELDRDGLRSLVYRLVVKSETHEAERSVDHHVQRLRPIDGVQRWQIVLDGNRRNNGIWRGKFYLYAAGRGSLKINILTTI